MMDVDLTRLTEAELVALNQRVVERIKVLRQRRYHASMAVFDVGDRVSFRPELGREVVGTVVRLNRKSVTVVGPHGDEWRVAPTLLTKVEGRAADAGKVATVIDLADARLRGRDV
jgi:hypothetical protein